MPFNLGHVNAEGLLKTAEKEKEHERGIALCNRSVYDVTVLSGSHPYVEPFGNKEGS